MTDVHIRIDVQGHEGTCWIDDVSMREAKPVDEWQAWRERGHDSRSVVADPGFAAAANGDYRLRPESPALKLGFEPIPMDRIGCYQDPLRASWPLVLAPEAPARAVQRWADTSTFSPEAGRRRGKGVRPGTEGPVIGLLCRREEDAQFAAVVGEVAQVAQPGTNASLRLLPLDNVSARRVRGELGKMDESIELFLDAACDRFSYLQLRVDLLGNRDTHGRNDPADEFTGRWRGAVARNAQGWTVEIAVPFAMLRAATPGAATLWTWNANRQRLAHGGPVQWTCWSDTKGGFHSPARFGQLVFTDFRAWLRFHVRQELGVVEEQTADLAARYPQVAGEFVARLGELDREQTQVLGDLTAHPLNRDDERRAAATRCRALVAAHEAALQELREVVLRDVLR